MPLLVQAGLSFSKAEASRRNQVPCACTFEAGLCSSVEVGDRDGTTVPEVEIPSPSHQSRSPCRSRTRAGTRRPADRSAGSLPCSRHAARNSSVGIWRSRSPNIQWVPREKCWESSGLAWGGPRGQAKQQTGQRNTRKKPVNSPSEQRSQALCKTREKRSSLEENLTGNGMWETRSHHGCSLFQ